MTQPMASSKDLLADIAALEQRQDVTALIAILRDCIARDRRVMTEPLVKAWCARRWKHLFLREAVEDLVALDVATFKGDRRSPRQRIAERFLFEGAEAAWKDEQPGPVETPLGRTTLLVCPGLLNGLLPVREFAEDLPRIAWRYRMPVLRSASHPVRGCEANVADIMRALNEGKGRDAAAQPIPDTAARTPGDVFVLAYSKGAPDTFTTLVRHPEIKARVRCIFTWAGAIGGSPVADDLAAKFNNSMFGGKQAVISAALKGFAHSVMSDAADARQRIDEYDTAAAVRDLTTGVRQKFLQEHAAEIDALDIPVFTFRGVTQLNEVPVSQRGGWRLLSKFEAQNDMQVAGSGSKMPIEMATELAVLHAHHWDMAYPAFSKRRWLNNTHHPFPKTAAITAMVQLGSELGLVD